MEQVLNRQEAAQLLQETGCTDEFARRFLTAVDGGRIDLQLRLLREQCAHERTPLGNPD